MKNNSGGAPGARGGVRAPPGRDCGAARGELARPGARPRALAATAPFWLCFPFSVLLNSLYTAHLLVGLFRT